MDAILGQIDLDHALSMLEARLRRRDAPPVRLVVCGGAALIATGLLLRSTRDVDVIALLDKQHGLITPSPFPEHLVRAIAETSYVLGLPSDWLNNGPSRGEGGLFQMGLPEGLQQRLHERVYGDRLTVYFVDRLDQIHFKLYAAVDRGGYHVGDLQALHPSDAELELAAHWARTHDVSEGFRQGMRQLLEALGHGTVATKL